MRPVSKEAMDFLLELDALCRKHGLSAIAPDEGVFVEDWEESSSWVGYAEGLAMEDISRFSRGGGNDQAR